MEQAQTSEQGHARFDQRGELPREDCQPRWFYSAPEPRHRKDATWTQDLSSRLDPTASALAGGHQFRRKQPHLADSLQRLALIRNIEHAPRLHPFGIYSYVRVIGHKRFEYLSVRPARS